MEIEIKVLEINPDEVRAQLIAAGAKPLGLEFQQNDMYDYADRRLYEKEDGSYIRIRRRHIKNQPVQAILTLKKTVSRTGYKIAEETETQVANPDAMHAFLTALGFVQIRRDEKLRESLSFQDIRFEIDEWAGLPPYLEVEAESEAAVSRGLALLGLTLADSTTKNLKEVLADYQVEASQLCFRDFGRNIWEELKAR